MFTITAKAQVKLISVKPDYSVVLIVSIRSCGCSGLGYHMEWQDYKIPYDKQFIIGDVFNPLVVGTDNKSNLFLESVTLDYEDGLNGKGFVWINDKSTRT